MARKNVVRISAIGITVLTTIFMLIAAGRLWENVGAEEIVIIQAPFSGKLAVYTTPGLKWQGFGKPTHYQKAAQIDCVIFPSEANDKGRHDVQVNVTNPLPVLPIRFNDAGKGWIAISDRWEMPLDTDNLIKLHMKFTSQLAIERDLVLRTLERAIYMTGPLYSSRESYAEKRPDLLSSIEDQAMNGIYKTLVRSEKRIDPLTGQEKTVDITERIPNPQAPNGFERATESPLREFGIRLIVGQLTINRLEYSEQVMNQITAQMDAIMKVQTAIAEAKEAEQNAITVAEQGKANAARSKWEQEVIKAQAVTEAEQKRDVAKLARDAAEFEKQRQILLGQGEAERKRLVLQADGALKDKLEALVQIQQAWAGAWAKNGAKIVPEVIMGGGENGNLANGADPLNEFLKIMAVNSARQLSVDTSVPKGAVAKQ